VVHFSTAVTVILPETRGRRIIDEVSSWCTELVGFQRNRETSCKGNNNNSTAQGEVNKRSAHKIHTKRRVTLKRGPDYRPTLKVR